MKTNSLKFCYSRLDPTQKSSLSAVFSDLFSGIQKFNTVYKRQGEGVISIEALRTPRHPRGARQTSGHPPLNQLAPSRIGRIRAASLQRPLWPSGACLPAGDGSRGVRPGVYLF